MAILHSLATFLLLLAVSIVPPLNRANGRVAFMGDSITFHWALPKANYGISGQTTAEMRARFNAFIPGHGYRTVVILGGTNDILLGVDPDTSIDNLSAMAQAAEAAHIQPILCEVPPIFRDLYGRPIDHTAQVQTLNEKIKKLASEHHWKLVDYYDAVANHPNYTVDGVHMRHRGYLAMEFALLRTQNVL